MNPKQCQKIMFALIIAMLFIDNARGKPKIFKGKNWEAKYECEKNVRIRRDGFAAYNETTLKCAGSKISPNMITYVDKCKFCWNPLKNRVMNDDRYKPVPITTVIEFIPTDAGTRNKQYTVIKACTCSRKQKSIGMRKKKRDGGMRD
uniref:uncharacterized protein LOC120348106 n=1 Tax=Styela clava TaxID=7725 RepID=UPI00193A7CA2|nr:uncharacterized protein LOC120348106 [Styela clava]